MAHDFSIPKHKRLTGKRKLVEESRRAVLEFAKVVQKDRLLLLSIVSGGPVHWRKVASKAFRGFVMDQTLLDDMFTAMKQQAGQDPQAQFEALQRADLVALKMERLRGLARFITSEAHLDEVLDRCVPAGDERAAIRLQMVNLLQKDGVVH